MTETSTFNFTVVALFIEPSDDPVIDAMRELCGLNGCRESIFGELHIRLLASDSEEERAELLTQFDAGVEELLQKYEQKLLEAAYEFLGKHSFTSGSEILELLETFQEMSQKFEFYDTNSGYLELGVAVDDLTEIAEADYIALAKTHFGEVNVKTPDELHDLWDDLKVAAHKADGIELPPAGDGESDEDDIDEAAAEETTATVEALAHSAEGKPVEEFA